MIVKQNQVSQTNNSKLVSQIPLISQSDKILIDARLLYTSLNVSIRFNDWIRRKIKEFGFKENSDFYSHLSKTKGRSRKEYHLTLDMAKELAMLERSEVGRSIRRYFIEQERKARGVTYLPDSKVLFVGLTPKTINDHRLYPYKEMVRRCGYSTKSSSASRKAKYWMHFVKEGNLLYITEEFAKHLYSQKNVYNNRKSLVTKTPVLSLNFAETKILNVPQF